MSSSSRNGKRAAVGDVERDDRALVVDDGRMVISAMLS